MANLPGTFTFGDSYQVSAQSPFDSRSVVNTIADLTADDSWNKNTHRPYKGMVVSVASTGDVYVLLDEKNPHSINNWKLQSGGKPILLTQSEYDSLGDDVDENTIYYIYDGD